ncbi:MAG: hypothetical protein EHM26_06750 [Desulfobacteraceae bacterium]|nr:MAG: hypothetical protein EHM26_06750 [Desulfobacteraceae bacterium]
MAEFAGRQSGDLSIEDVLSQLNRITEGKKPQMIKVIFRYTHLMTTQRHLGKVTDTEAIWWMTASTRIAAEAEVRKAPPGFLCYLKDMQVLRAGVAFGTRAGICNRRQVGPRRRYRRFSEKGYPVFSR